MKQYTPDSYKAFAEHELRGIIAPAITQAGGKVISAVHLGSTVTNPPPYKIWEFFPQGQQDISKMLWGFKGPNDVDLAVFYSGDVDVKAIKRRYLDIQNHKIVGSLRGDIPPDSLDPILEPNFYSVDYVERMIDVFKGSKLKILEALGELNNNLYRPPPKSE